MNNAQKYLASLSPGDRRAILSRGGKTVKKRRGLFKDGESRAQEAGRAGGKATAAKRAIAKALTLPASGSGPIDGIVTGLGEQALPPVRPVAMVVEQLDGNEARVQWMFNPVPDGETLLWDHGPAPADPSPATVGEEELALAIGNCDRDLNGLDHVSEIAGPHWENSKFKARALIAAFSIKRR